MAAQTIIVGGAAPARRQSAAPAHRGTSGSETLGWLLFGAIALAAIYWLTRKGSTTSGAPAAPDTFGLPLSFLPDFSSLIPAAGPVATVTADSGSVAGVPIGTLVPCYDPRLATKMLPGEYIDNSGSHPKLCYHAPGAPYGSDQCFGGCPNDILLLRS